MIDIGANLTNKRFRHDTSSVLNNARNAGLEQILITGTSVLDSTNALDIAQQSPNFLKSTAGVHPHYASGWNEGSRQAIKTLAENKLVVAIGECGLDFNRDLSPRHEQEYCFEQQLVIASELQLPVFLHERDAYERFSAILMQHTKNIPAAVVHCFTGSKTALKHYLDLGCYIGITGWVCDERRGQELREIVSYIPEDRLMLETDAPYLLPRNIKPKPKGGRNEPAFLNYIVEELAEIRGVSTAALKQSSTLATKTFFKLNNI